MTVEPAERELHAAAFFLADHAVVESGKLYVNGGFWNRIGQPSFPAVMTFSVVLVLHVPWRAHDQSHRFAVKFVDADGQDVPGDFSGDFQVGRPFDMRAGDFTLLPVAATLTNFMFTRPGDCSCVLSLDGADVERRMIKVVQTFGSPAASGNAQSQQSDSGGDADD